MIYLRTLAILLVAGVPLQAGIVQTLSARLEGKVLLEKDAVSIGGKTIAWADVLYLLPDSRPSVVRSQRVHLRNGESWAADILRLSDGNLEVRSDLFGVKKLDLALVAELQFVSQASAETERKTGVLYRVKGEAIPGKLLALTRDKITIDSAVGELDLPREGLSSFRFAAARSIVEQGMDEVALADGSLFYGKLSLEAEGTKLEHPALGRIKLSTNVVRSVVRHLPQMFDLLQLPPRLLQSTPVLPPEKSPGEPFRIISGLNVPSPVFIKGLLIEPKTVVVWKLPGKNGAKGKLRALVAAVAGEKGDVRLTIRTADKVLLERDLGPTTKADMISLDVQAGQELQIAVEFGELLRFPCAAVLGDPHIIWDRP
jgi:hypothetical protein